MKISNFFINQENFIYNCGKIKKKSAQKVFSDFSDRFLYLFVFFWICHNKTTGFIHAYQFVSLMKKNTAAFRAFLI